MSFLIAGRNHHPLSNSVNPLLPIYNLNFCNPRQLRPQERKKKPPPPPPPPPQMGQSASASRPTSSPVLDPLVLTSDSDDAVSGYDYTLDLLDECLALIFHSLSAGDRKRSSLVCRRWLAIEGQTSQQLALNAQSQLADAVPRLFSRFDAVTKLTLKCDRRSVSISRNLISLKCWNLIRLKLRACRELTDDGMAAFGENCTNLCKFSCGSCSFGARGVNALLENCEFLEELSVKRLRGITNGAAAEPIRPGKVAVALKMICLKDLYNAQSFFLTKMTSSSFAIWGVQCGNFECHVRF